MNASAPTRGTLLILAFYLALSVAWTWPWARFDDTLPTRQFDLFGVVWVLEHARDLLDLRASASEWPTGEDVTRLDTWVLAAIGLVRGWVGLDTIVTTRLLVLLAPVVSALAMESCARRLDIARPWSVIAGVIFGFSGIGATALLEGHVYALLVPWLPLLLRDLHDATSAGGRARVGARAGLWWALCLLTSAYTGLVATLVGGVWLVRSVRERWAWRGIAGFFAVVVPLGVAYTALFQHGRGSVASDPATVLLGGSASLATLATWSPDVDLQNHSMAAPLGFVTVALVLAGVIVLRRYSTWRTLLGIAVLGVVLALGPAVQAGMGGHGLVYWLDLQGGASWLGLLHFPLRFIVLWYLGAGLVAARAAQAIAATNGRSFRVNALGVFALVLADVFVTSGFAARTGRVDLTAPSAYGSGPLVDLVPEDPFPGSGVELGARRLVCLYQASHREPVLGRCLGPHGSAPHDGAERALRAALLDGGDVRAAVEALGAAAIVVHLDLFRPEDRALIVAGLQAVLGEPRRSKDGGESVVVFGE